MHYARTVSFPMESLVEHTVNFVMENGKGCVQVIAFIDTHSNAFRQHCFGTNIIWILRDFTLFRTSLRHLPPIILWWVSLVVGGVGLWLWPVALYIAITHRWHSFSSLTPINTDSPSLTAFIKYLPPSSSEIDQLYHIGMLIAYATYIDNDTS